MAELALARVRGWPFLCRLLVSGSIAAILVLMFWFLHWSVTFLQGWQDYVDPKSAETRAAIREGEAQLAATIVQVLGGALVIFALLLTLYVSQRTLSMARDSQIAERFTKAVEHLGSNQIEVRLGGIYALERVAHDYPEKYHAQTVELLSAVVREKSPAVKPLFSLGVVATDIQAILTVLGRRPHKNRR